MGSVFEDMCKYYTLISGVDGKLNCFVTTVGKWWGTHPKRREATDIDVVGLDRISKKAVLGECKYRNVPIDKNVYEDLQEKNGLITKEYTVVQYIFFSKSGFTEWVTEHCERDGVKLVELGDMYG